MPIDVLTDLVRSYTTQASSVVPQFLEISFEMLREGLENMIKNISSSKSISSFEAIKAKQEAFGATFLMVLEIGLFNQPLVILPNKMK